MARKLWRPWLNSGRNYFFAPPKRYMPTRLVAVDTLCRIWVWTTSWHVCTLHWRPAGRLAGITVSDHHPRGRHCYLISIPPLSYLPAAVQPTRLRLNFKKSSSYSFILIHDNTGHEVIIIRSKQSSAIYVTYRVFQKMYTFFGCSELTYKRDRMTVFCSDVLEWC
jgi:hypothetical protein